MGYRWLRWCLHRCLRWHGLHPLPLCQARSRAETSWADRTRTGTIWDAGNTGRGLAYCTVPTCLGPYSAEFLVFSVLWGSDTFLQEETAEIRLVFPQTNQRQRRNEAGHVSWDCKSTECLHLKGWEQVQLKSYIGGSSCTIWEHGFA